MLSLCRMHNKLLEILTPEWCMTFKGVEDKERVRVVLHRLRVMGGVECVVGGVRFPSIVILGEGFDCRLP